MDHAVPVIDVEEVSYAFKRHRALNDVSFQVWPGSIHGFVGPNGAGKTTALKLICTLLRPQLGRIRVFGADVREDVRAVRRRLGFMPDHFSLYRQMTVYEYLDFFGAAYGHAQDQRDRTVADVLALTDMDHRRDDLIQGLSRGMQQRVSLARVLVNDPDLLLLDEPAAGLDPRARIELMAILRELRGMGKSIFISSHILSELAELCDSVTIIDRGRIKFTGRVRDLLQKDVARPVYRVELDCNVDGFGHRLEQVTGVIDVIRLEGEREYSILCDHEQIDSAGLLREILGMGASLVSFRRDVRHLNEAFMELTEQGVRP